MIHRGQQAKSVQYVQKNLVNVKFIMLISQLIACILALLHENIAAGLNANFQISDEAYYNAQVYELSFGVLSVIFQFSEIGLIFIGLTLTYNRLNSILCLFHTIGALSYIFFLLDKWHYMIIAYLWVVFCLIPLSTEVLMSVQAYLFFGITMSKDVFKAKQMKSKTDEVPKKEEEEKQQLIKEGEPKENQQNLEG